MAAPFKDYETNKSDKHGNKIIFIHTLTPSYVIYESESSGIGILHYEDYPLNTCAKNLSKISDKMSIVKILMAADRKMVNAQMALAWKLCFEKKFQRSEKVLDSLITKLMVKGKIKYILSAFITFLIVIAISFIVYYYFRYYADEINMDRSNMAKFAFLGALGGLISIVIKLKSIYLDPNSNTLNIISGSSRILISVTSAILFYFGYKAQILLAIFNSGEQNEIYFLYFFSFISGFAERFIPDIASGADKILKLKQDN